MLLYFARHGESEANLMPTFSNRDLPHHLTELGKDQARRLASKLGTLGVGELWSSPIPRAVETAAIVGSVLGLSYQTTDALREFDVGSYEGTASAEGWQEYANVVQAWIAGDYKQRVGGGESLTEVVGRLKTFLQQLMEDWDESVPIACIGHGGLYFSALPHVLTNVSPDFAFQNTRGYDLLITVEAAQGDLTCVDWSGIPPR